MQVAESRSSTSAECAAAGIIMPDVVLYERATSFPDSLALRGHHIVYRANSSNHCPGCGRSQWYVGRVSAECGFCGTAIALAEARLDQGPNVVTGASSRQLRPSVEEHRRFPRMSGEGRSLELMIGDSPASFALKNISAGGMMGGTPVALTVGSEVLVRLEGGELVGATVKWTDKGLVGLAFIDTVREDGSAQ